MLVGDPSSGYSYKCTITALATIIETDIADGYVTIGTTQTISGAKTFLKDEGYSPQWAVLAKDL